MALAVGCSWLAWCSWSPAALADAHPSDAASALGFGHPGVRKILRLMLPGLFGSSVAQISILLDTLIASMLATGSISWLYYSDRLMEFPLGVFGIALATVMLPSLSRQHARSRCERLRHDARLGDAARLLIVTPATLGADAAGRAAARHAVLRRVQRRGRRMTTLSLMAYAAGPDGLHPGQGAGARLLRAPGHPTPVRIGLIALAQHGAQPVSWCCRWVLWHRPGPMRRSRSTSASRLYQCRRCCIGACAGARCCRHAPGWGACCAGGRAVALMGVSLAGRRWTRRRWMAHAYPGATWRGPCVLVAGGGRHLLRDCCCAARHARSTQPRGPLCRADSAAAARVMAICKACRPYNPAFSSARRMHRLELVRACTTCATAITAAW